MSLSEKLRTQGVKPSGVYGRLGGRIMNLGHSNVYRWGLKRVSIEPDSIMLDVGCGGGKAIRFLAKKASNGKVCGIDHSLEMVDLSRKVNKSFIKNGRVEISQGSVSSLPYSDDLFDIVTAFETIQFWPNLREDLKEIKRVLKPSGTFLIVNRYPKPDSKWTEFLQLHTPEEYRNSLNAAGYVDITIDDSSKSNWILALAQKTIGEPLTVGRPQ